MSLKLQWLGLGGQTVKNMHGLACKFDLDQSELAKQTGKFESPFVQHLTWNSLSKITSVKKWSLIVKKSKFFLVPGGTS